MESNISEDKWKGLMQRRMRMQTLGSGSVDTRSFRGAGSGSCSPCSVCSKVRDVSTRFPLQVCALGQVSPVVCPSQPPTPERGREPLQKTRC